MALHPQPLDERDVSVVSKAVISMRAPHGLICWKWTPKLEWHRRSFVHEIEK